MKSFQWSDGYVVGIDSVDEQHQRLVDIINRIFDLLTSRHITKRSRGWLINDAVDRYLSYEEWFMKAVEEGVEDVDAGRVVSHDEVKREWENKLANSMD